MTIEFSEVMAAGEKQWQGVVEGISGTKVVDLERVGRGFVSVSMRMSGTEKWKYVGSVSRANVDANVVFAVASEGDDAVVDVLLVSGSEVVRGSYS